MAIILPISAFTFKYQRRLIYYFLRSFLFFFSFYNGSINADSFMGHSMSTWSALILTMGETSVIVALVMGEVFKRERAKGLFKAVIKNSSVSFGPLATVTHHHPQLKGKTRKGADVDELDDSEDSIDVVTKESSKESKQRKRDRVKAASMRAVRRVILWFLTLPLNFFPLAGQIAFCYINGKARVPDIHRKYFDLKGMTDTERKDWIKKRETQYTAFGFVCQGLELIPVLGIFFSFTNTIGAALWAIDLEQEQDALRNKKLLEEAYASE
ncbi:hypothetical protein BGZ46_007479 [Entomortierella lignicola]|nr:hypothetical protein BGZ46_007479 [Entomortierella lignicola]KAF9202196.1 hypothetical protein BGZ49_007609 [Haplosporangium sp. Z 27]